MAFKTRENSGALFKNNRKEKKTHPDFQGKIVLSPELAEIAADGGELQLAAWKQTSEAGNNYISIAVSEPYEADEAPKKKKKAAVVDEDEEEEEFEEAPRKKKPVTTKRKKVDEDDEEEDDF